MWNYKFPQKLNKYKKQYEKNKAHLSLFMFPMNANKLLDADTFSEEDLANLERVLEHITKVLKYETTDPNLTTIKDYFLVVEGLKLVANKDGIVSLDVATVNKIKENIECALKNLWLDSDIANYPYDGSNLKYDSILAKVIGKLAKNNEEDKWIRIQVANLVCSPRGISVSNLVKNLVNTKAKESFILEVLSFIFEYSKICSAWNDVHHVVSYSGDKNMNMIKKNFCKNSFVRKKIFRSYTIEDRESIFKHEVLDLMNKFIESSSFNIWPEWDFNLYSYEFTHGLKLPKSERELINLENFTQAASNLSPFELWGDSLTAGWNKFCSSGLDKISRRLKNSIQKNGDIINFPYQKDQWVINMFATTYYWRDEVMLEESLKSFFEVGEYGLYWLSNFGTRLFKLGKNKNWKVLKFKIEKIFDLALSVKELESSRSLDADEIWCSLVGLDESTIHFLADESNPLITDLFSLYERLIKIRSGSDKCLGRFTALLCKNAAANIRIKGLALVASELKEVDFSRYMHQHDISTYSYFLTTLWKENQKELLNDNTVMSNFQQILNGLILIQDSVALELAAKINSSR